MGYADDITVDGVFLVVHINSILDRFASFSGLHRNTIKSQIYSHINSPRIDALSAKYGLENVTDKNIRILGAHFIPSSPDNTTHLFELLKTRMQKCVQLYSVQWVGLQSKSHYHYFGS